MTSTRTVNGETVEVVEVRLGDLQVGDLVCNDNASLGCGLENRVVAVRKLTELDNDWEVELSDGTEWLGSKSRARASRLTGLVAC